jgi:hypothetical protein
MFALIARTPQMLTVAVASPSSSAPAANTLTYQVLSHSRCDCHQMNAADRASAKRACAAALTTAPARRSGSGKRRPRSEAAAHDNQLALQGKTPHVACQHVYCLLISSAHLQRWSGSCGLDVLCWGAAAIGAPHRDRCTLQFSVLTIDAEH